MVPGGSLRKARAGKGTPWYRHTHITMVRLGNLQQRDYKFFRQGLTMEITASGPACRFRGRRCRQLCTPGPGTALCQKDAYSRQAPVLDVSKAPGPSGPRPSSRKKTITGMSSGAPCQPAPHRRPEARRTRVRKHSSRFVIPRKALLELQVQTPRPVWRQNPKTRP